jgi:hypothetical protein
MSKADATGEYVSSNGKPLEHTGTDAEALAIAVRLQDEHWESAARCYLSENRIDHGQISAREKGFART